MSQQIQCRLVHRLPPSVRSARWNLPPRFPIMEPRAGVATSSPNGFTRFCRGMAVLYRCRTGIAQDARAPRQTLSAAIALAARAVDERLPSANLLDGLRNSIRPGASPSEAVGVALHNGAGAEALAFLQPAHLVAVDLNLV